MGRALANPNGGREAVAEDERALLKGLSSKFGQSREQTVELWPETLPAINLFTRSITQWRAGPSGLIGLDYLAVNLLMDLDDVRMSERSGLLSDVSYIERGYLQAMRR